MRPFTYKTRVDWWWTTWRVSKATIDRDQGTYGGGGGGDGDGDGWLENEWLEAGGWGPSPSPRIPSW